MKIRGLGLLLLALWAAFLAAPAPARAEGKVTAVAEAGFEGRVKSGAWVPVTVTLTNSGGDFEGEVVFSAATEMGPSKLKSEYRTPVTLPAGATKRVRINIPGELGISVPEIRLVSGGNDVAAVKFDQEYTGDALVGVLGVDPAELKGLAGAKLGEAIPAAAPGSPSVVVLPAYAKGKGAPTMPPPGSTIPGWVGVGKSLRLIRLTPERFPTEPLVLENLDAVLLDRFAYGELPEAQRQALQAWVEHGGTLILAGGPEGRRLSALSPWLPLTVRSVETVTVDAVGQEAALAVADLPGWTVVRRAGAGAGGSGVVREVAGAGLPLVAHLSKGAGTVWFLAFDPALEPFASWPGLVQLTESLLPTSGGMGPMGPAMGPGGPNSMLDLANSLNQQPIRELPSFKWLLYLLAAYAIIIGPVQFLLLRGLRRTGWALATMPVLALVGAGWAWGFIGHAKAADVVVTTLNVIEGQPGASTLRVRSVAGLFMPPGSTHDIAMKDALLVPVPGPFEQFNPGGPPLETETKAVVEQGRLMRTLPVERWATRAVGTQAAVTTPGTVSGSLIIQKDKAQGMLTSALPFRLQDTMVIAGGAFQKLGKLAPGESAEISLALSSINAGFNPKMGPSGSVIDTMQRASQPGQWGPEGPSPEQYQQMRRLNMVWQALSGIRWLNSLQQPPVVLVGWTDWSPLPVSVDGREVSADALGIYVQPVAYAFGDGEFSVPPGFLGHRVTAWSGGAGPGMITPGWNLMKDQSVTFEVSLPGELAPGVNSLELRIPQFGRPPSGKFPLVVQFWAWGSSQWTDLPVDNFEVVKAENAGRFVGRDGTVRIRLTKVTEEQIGMGVPSLSADGRRVMAQ